ncbi:MAG: hypothetical protein ACTSVB_10430 [Candidatus Heimdallarchaeaceae archaeon]
MVSSELELYIKIAQITVISFILAYFIYRRIKDKITGFNWFIFLFISALTQGIVEMILYGLTKNGIISENSTLQEIHIIPYAVGLFILFLYCELIMRERPNEILLSFMTLLLGAYLATFSLELAFNLNSDILPKYRLNRLIFNIFQFFVLLEATLMFAIDAKRVEYKKLRRISLVLAVAIGISAVFAFFKILEYWVIPFSFYGAIPYGILFGVLALEFIANPFFVYLLPSRINKVVVIDESGVLLFAVRVGKEEPNIVEDTLLSGTLSAMKSVIKETTGTQTELQKIEFRDKYMIVAENEEKTISTIIICDRNSFMLQTAAKQFINAFTKEFKEHLEKFDGSIGKFGTATHLVRRIFPFVPPKEIVEVEEKGK